MIAAQTHIILSILFNPLWDFLFSLQSIYIYRHEHFLNNCVLKQKLCHYRYQI
jgi:hypothetical protein